MILPHVVAFLVITFFLIRDFSLCVVTLVFSYLFAAGM